MTRYSICILTLLVPVLQTSAVDFVQPDYFPVGSAPQAMASADFNGDGFADLAVVNSQDDTISILLGDGQGSFVTASLVPTGPYSMALDSGDFNEDGQVDLLVVEADFEAVRLLWGDGQGGFADGPALVVSARPRTVTNADFNGDGHLDLVVGLEGPGFMDNGMVVVYMGTGDGQFIWIEEHEVWSHSIQLLLVDMNSDGILDLLSANPSFGGPVGGLTVFLGNEFGGFSMTSQTLGADESLAVADFDEDGFLDVAATQAEDFVCAPEYRIWFGDGQGSFSGFEIHEVGCFTDFVRTADFDVDGHADLAFTDLTTGQVYILEGDGAAGFGSPLEVSISTIPWSPVVEDFDNDGDADIGLVAVGSNSVAILLNQTHPHFIRGDADADGVVLGIVDAIYLLTFGFMAGPSPPCDDAADFDDNGSLNSLADGLALLAFVFLDGPPPSAPGLVCGVDPTADALGCDQYDSCP